MLFGRAGWRSYHLIDRLRMHPEQGRRSFWVEDGSDAELGFAYRNAVALIFASHGEGFGLLLVEVMHYGAPGPCVGDSRISGSWRRLSRFLPGR
jgi:glycosyltransferase involved in cell wall biosynthesis